MEKCKTKGHSGIFRHIHAYSDIFRHISKTYPNIIRHIQAYSGIIQANSKPFVTLAYSELWYIQNPGIFKTRGIFRTLVHPKLWHIQNLRHTQNPELLKTLEYSQPETYSKPRQTCTMEHLEKQLTAAIFFATSALSSISPNKHDCFNAGLIFTPEVFIQYKKVWVPGWKDRRP